MLEEEVKERLARGEQVRAVVMTVEGEFVFDVRDRYGGWPLSAGEWEPTETAFVKSIVRSGDLVVDAGANLGWYSVLASRLVAPGGIVLAFEPDPTNAGLLALNATRNNATENLRLFVCALYECDTTVAFELSVENFGDHRIRVEGARGLDLYGENSRRTLSVPARSLDNVLSDEKLGGRPIRLMKVDTQGSEVAIFRGGLGALQRTEYLVSEFWPYGLMRAGYEVGEYSAIVREYFSEFARLTSPNPPFASIAKLEDDLSLPHEEAPETPAGFTNYVFRKTSSPTA